MRRGSTPYWPKSLSSARSSITSGLGTSLNFRSHSDENCAAVSLLPALTPRISTPRPWKSSNRLLKPRDSSSQPEVESFG